MQAHLCSFQSQKSGQNQQDDTELTTEHYGSKCGINRERGGREASERHLSPGVGRALSTTGEKHHSIMAEGVDLGNRLAGVRILAPLAVAV